jgi:hypothetical protein
VTASVSTGRFGSRAGGKWGLEMHLVFHFVLMVTALLIVAYFLFLTASKAQGLTSAFGRILGLWLLLLTAVIIGGVVTAHMNGGRPYGMDFPMGHRHGMHGDGPWNPPEPPAAPEAQPTPEVAPQPPAAPAKP